MALYRFSCRGIRACTGANYAKLAEHEACINAYLFDEDDNGRITLMMMMMMMMIDDDVVPCKQRAADLNEEKGRYTARGVSLAGLSTAHNNTPPQHRRESKAKQ
jgi:hypothetical protein